MKMGFVGVVCVALAALGCTEHAETQDSWAEQSHAATTYKPTVCVDWNAPDGSGIGATNCDAGSDVVKAYKIATTQAPAGMQLTRFRIEPPSADNPDAVKAFFTQARALSAHLKTANAAADVVRRTAEELRAQCDRLRARQKELDGERQVKIDALVTGLEEHVRGQLDATRRTEQSNLSSFRRRKEAAEPVIARAHERLAKLGADLAPLVARHKQFVATEKPVFVKLADIAARGSKGSITTLTSLQQELIGLERTEAPTCDQFEIDVVRLQSRISFIMDDYTFELGGLRQFLKQLGLERAVPGAATALTDVLTKIGSYCERRQPKFNEAYVSILDGLRRRGDALVQAAADAATQKTLSDARFLRASGDFLRTSSARSARLATLPRSSQRLKLFYLFPKYQEHEATIALEPMCTESGLAAVSFMDAGCEVIKRDISKSRNYIGISVPALIKAALPRLKTAGVDATLLDSIAADIAAKRFRKAAQDYDVAVSLSEKVVMP